MKTGLYYNPKNTQSKQILLTSMGILPESEQKDLARRKEQLPFHTLVKIRFLNENNIWELCLPWSVAWTLMQLVKPSFQLLQMAQ